MKLAAKLSVFTSLLNKASACAFEVILVASLTPAITSPVLETFTSAALISTKLRAKTLPSIVTLPVPGALNLDL